MTRGTTVDKASTARPGVRGEGQEAILAAAAEAFMERGYAATTIDDIADRLGATKGRVYHYYRSKADIFLDVQRSAMQRMLEMATPIVLRAVPPLDRLGALAHAHALLLMTSLAFQRVSVQGIERHLLAQRTSDKQRQALDRVIEMRDRYQALVVGLLEDGMADGSMRRSDARVTVKSVLGALNWIVMWYRPREGESAAARDLLARNVAAFVVAGVRA